ncbi:Nop-domain-containing protein [Wallemia mellicola]|nr:Nop-domain-containing protein [Wallemia mellicola]
MPPSHILFESSAGYLLLKCNNVEEIASKTKAVQEQINDYHHFSKIVNIVSIYPFADAAEALQNANSVSEGELTDQLKSLLEQNLPKGSKSGVVLGVSDKALATSIKSELKIEGDVSDLSLELIRGVRIHAEKLIEGLSQGDLLRAQLGLGHSYSRAKVKFNVNRSDNMIIQAIALVDQLDKDVNTFSMRAREWYGWHFPELVKIVPDNHQYALCARLIGDKSTLTEEKIPQLMEIIDDDETRARNVIDASRSSMGTDISPVDLINIKNFADRVVGLSQYRKNLHAYLLEKMNLVAPNLSALIGEFVGARLISHAGSLTNLSKYPASTVQILGAEKALFRALKTKGNTPKYGLLYHASAIGRAAPKNKGRISRFLANKVTIASRIDCFSDAPTTKFGEALKNQVEERLQFYETGQAPSKNVDVMRKALDAIAADMDLEDEDASDDEKMDEDKPKLSEEEKKAAEKAAKKAAKAAKKEKKEEPEEREEKEEKKKDKKDKKKRKSEVAEESAETPAESPEKKDKKKRKSEGGETKEEKKARKRASKGGAE